MTVIKYNNVNPFSGQPTPFFGVSKNNISYGERWAENERLVLVGQLTGCELSGIISAQTQIISGFSKDFQNLEIIQGNGLVSAYENVTVNSINFDSSNYVGVLPYRIELSCYPSSGFSTLYRVLDPSNTWSYQEGRDGLIQITHEVSARGLNISGSGLDNAKNFVLSKTGLSNFISPAFIRKFNGAGVLKRQSERIDRLAGSYSITEEFISDQFASGQNGILRYSVEYGKNQAGFNSVSINGSFEGGINDNFELIKNRARDFDYYSSAFYGVNTGIKLNPIPISKNITENPQSRKIDFSLNFDDNPYLAVNTIYDISINSGEDLIRVSVNGEVNGRGDLAEKWNKIKSQFNLLNPYLIASSGLSGYAPIKLNKTPVTESVTTDEFNGAISFAYEYTDKENAPNNNLQDFNYSINVTPPLRKIISTPLFYASGNQTGEFKYNIMDMGFNRRGSFQINGDAIPVRGINDSQAELAIKDAIRGKFFRYCTNPITAELEKYSISNTNNGTFGFSVDFSYDHTDVIQGDNYSVISFL